MVLTLPQPKSIGMVSLGCPKALVDSERILTQLRRDGYRMSPSYADADVVLVNTCGFLDSAKEPKAWPRSARRSPRTAASSSPAAWGNEADAIMARTGSPSRARGHRARTSMRRPWSRPSTMPPRRASGVGLYRPRSPQPGREADPAGTTAISRFQRVATTPAPSASSPTLRGQARQPARSTPSCAKRRSSSPRGTKRAAGDQPGYLGLRRRYPATPSPRLARSHDGPRTYDRPRPRARPVAHRRGPPALGAAPLCLSLSARRQR